MHSGTSRRIRDYCGAVLITCVAMAVSGVSGATTVGAAGSGRPNPSFSQTSNTNPWNKGCNWCLRGGSALGMRSHQARSAASARPTAVAMFIPTSFEFANLETAASSSNSTAASTDVLGILAADIVPVSTISPGSIPVEFAGTVTTSLETRTTWRSNSFSIAGSRIWSKIVKFSSTGINVRLPLN
jgi:hypothetical protein